MSLFKKIFGEKVQSEAKPEIRRAPEYETKHAKAVQPTRPSQSAQPAPSAPAPAAEKKEPMTYVFTPPLCLLLTELEKRKGSPLTAAEVEAARDKAVCVVQSVATKRALDAQRKYRDLDPRDIWNEWQLFKQYGLEKWSAAYVEAMKNVK
jgi:hypothetical protein